MFIDDEAVERVSSFKYLGAHITEDFSWDIHTSTVIRKAQQCLYFLRRPRKARLLQNLLVNFYQCTVENILTYCITAWYASCTRKEQKALQRVHQDGPKYQWDTAAGSHGHLFNDYALKFGFPLSIQNDQGGEFENQLFAELKKNCGVIGSRTALWAPRR